MKKTYSFLLLLAFFCGAQLTNANVINVSVSNYNFMPASFTAAVGDVVVFKLVSGTHNVTGTSIPAEASSMNSGTLSTVGQQYSYTITAVGSYTYKSTFHTNMIGGFTVTTTGIIDPATDLITKVYPSPFKDRITVKYNGIEEIDFYNVIGENVKSVKLDAIEAKFDIDFGDLPSGVYFYRTYKDGVVAETRKLVKTK